MNARMVKHDYLCAKWTPIIAECKCSGKSVRLWCQENDVDEKQFYYWQRRIREKLYQAQAQAQAPVAYNNNLITNETHFAALPKQIVSSALESTSCMSSNIVLIYGDVKMEIADTTSPFFLADLLKALRHAH